METKTSLNFLASSANSLRPLRDIFSLKDCKDYAMTQRNRLLHFAFFLIISFGFIYAQSGNETLKKIQNKFKSLTDFSASFNQTISDPTGQQGNKLSGKFYYKRKNNFIVELKNGSIISNGETVWNYDSRQKRVVISYFSDDPTSFSLERYIFDYPSLCNVKSIPNEKGKEEIIELVPKDNNIDFKSAKIWKNTEDMISRMEIVDLADAKFVLQLSAIKVDQEIPDTKFNFIPPKGIKIIDLR